MKLVNKVCLAIFWLLAAMIPSYAEYTADELMRLTLESLSYDVGSDTARARGAGRIMKEGNTGLMVARRVAISDALRGLLILRRGIREKKPPRPHSVSGNVPPFRVISEEARDGVYFVEIETKLSSLMREKEHQYDSAKILYGENDDEEGE